MTSVSAIRLQELAVLPRLGATYVGKVATMAIDGGFSDGLLGQRQSLLLQSVEGGTEGIIELRAKTEVKLQVNTDLSGSGTQSLLLTSEPDPGGIGPPTLHAKAPERFVLESSANAAISWLDGQLQLQATTDDVRPAVWVTNNGVSSILQVGSTNASSVIVTADGSVAVGKADGLARERLDVSGNMILGGADGSNTSNNCLFFHGLGRPGPEIQTIIAERRTTADPEMGELFIGKMNQGTPDLDAPDYFHVPADRIRHVAATHKFQGYGSHVIEARTPYEMMSLSETQATDILNLSAGLVSVPHDVVFSKDSPDEPGGQFMITTEGQVGIRQTNPLAALHVSGDVLIDQSPSLEVLANTIILGTGSSNVYLDGNIHVSSAMYASGSITLGYALDSHIPMDGLGIHLPDLVVDGQLAEKSVHWMNGPLNNNEDAVFKTSPQTSAKWVLQGGDLALQRKILKNDGSYKLVSYILSIDEYERLVLVKTNNLRSDNSSDYQMVSILAPLITM